MKFNYVQFLTLHRALLMRFLVMDIMLGICSALFLSVTMTIHVLSLNNCTLLISIVVFAVFFQMHAYRTYCGNLAYYLMLPIKRVLLLPFCIIIGSAPFILALVIYAAAHVTFNLSLHTGTSIISFSERLAYLLVVLTLIKLLPLPLMILYKKHIVLVPLFCMALAFLYLLLSFIREMVSVVIPINTVVMALLFLCGTLFISGKIIARASVDEV